MTYRNKLIWLKTSENQNYIYYTNKTKKIPKKIKNVYLGSKFNNDDIIKSVKRVNFENENVKGSISLKKIK